MKTYFVIVIFASCAWGVRAQSNSVLPGSAPRVTHIDASRADFDLNKRTAVYRGNVRVTDPQMKLTCEWLEADLPQSGHINHIVAETNVVINFTDSKGQAMHATGEKAVYSYSAANGTTNETVTLTGNPKVIGAQGTSTADAIIWNRLSDSFQFINPHATIQSFGGLSANTNSTPAKTNGMTPSEK